MKSLSQLFISVIVVVALFLLALPVLAADITVNATCSLPDAITSANTDTATGGCTAGSGDDTIQFDTSALVNDVYTTPSDRELTHVKSNIIIEGGGKTLKPGLLPGGGGTRVLFWVETGALTIRNLTIRDVNSRAQYGPVILLSHAGSGSLPVVTIQNSTISNNTSGSGALFLHDGTLTISNSSIANNTAFNDGVADSGSDGEGGAIYVGGGSTVNINNSTFYGNNSGSNGRRNFRRHGHGYAYPHDTCL